MRFRLLLGGSIAAALFVVAPSHARHRTTGARAHHRHADLVAATVMVPVVKRSPMGDWLRARLPAGGQLHERAGELPEVFHVVRDGDTYQSIAEEYLDLTSVYDARDLARAIRRDAVKSGATLTVGNKIAIPAVLTEPYLDRRMPRTDEPMRGIYVRGETAGKGTYPAMLDKVRRSGMNSIVLDAKDYDGWITYPTKVALANEAGAVKHPPIASLSRAIRFAHDRDVRVIVRVSCFEDEHMAKARPKMSVQSKAGRAYPIGWLDPSNEQVQEYVVSLVKEAIDAGADEVELDYVRFPVLGIKNADFHLEERGLTKTGVIRDFVRRVHAVTKARGVPLSLDVFGIISLGRRADIDSLGQDPALLAAECEALSPMVYPSHYGSGMFNFQAPGDHPEVAGLGTRGVLEQLEHVHHAAVVRPWIQAASWKSSGFGQGYIAREIHSVNDAGASGWLMWNPGQRYDYAWGAVPHAKKKKGASQRERE